MQNRKRTFIGYRRKWLAPVLSAAVLVTSGLLPQQASAGGVLPQHPSSIASENKKQELPLGTKNLDETREKEHLTPGVTYTHIKRGFSSKHAGYTVDIGFYESKEQAKEVAEQLKKNGFKPRIHRVKDSRYNDIQRKALGFVVYAGKFGEKQQAVDLKDKIATQGYINAGVTHTTSDGSKATGPWNIHVLEIDPDQFEGQIASELATNKIRGKAKTTKTAERMDALAAVNGGYFVVGPDDGTPGDLAGISMVSGELLSEPVGNRTSLILTSNGASIAKVGTTITVKASDGAKREIDGLNRKPGLIRSCGGVGGDKPSEKPMHDVTCTDGSELIKFTSAFGKGTPEGKGIEVVLNKNGVVTELRKQRGGYIPEKGMVLAGTDTAADWLREHAKPGMPLQVKTTIQSNGKSLKYDDTTSIINGAPRLLKDNRITINAKEEGFYWSREFYFRFGKYRHPRTLAGITKEGNLLFVTVDGRNPEKSIGINFEESAKLMRAFGAVDALNLDGGGSATMVINDRLVNHPSDSTGERPVGSSIVILPKE